MTSLSLSCVHQETVGQVADLELEGDVEPPEDPGRGGEGEVRVAREGRLGDSAGCPAGLVWAELCLKQTSRASFPAASQAQSSGAQAPAAGVAVAKAFETCGLAASLAGNDAGVQPIR